MNPIKAIVTRIQDNKYLPTLVVERNGRTFHVRATFKLTEKMIEQVVSEAEKFNRFMNCYVTVLNKYAPITESESLEIVCHNGAF